MMAGFEAFDRDIRVATAGLSREGISRELAKFARRELAKAISAGASRQYDRYVNGRLDAPEESVIPPGPIIYEFTNWALVINAALAELVKRSPRRSGVYAKSFVVIVGGRAVTSYSAIPSQAEIIITNAQPYVRRVELRRRPIDGTKNALSRRFKDAFRFETRFLNLGHGIHPLVPYQLKGGGRKAGVLSYPSIVINVL